MGLQKQSLEGQVNHAEQAKEYEKEQEKIARNNEKAVRELIRWTLQQQTLNDKVKELASLQDEFGRKQGSAQIEAETKGLIERNEAERQFREDTLTRKREAAITEIDIEQEKVRELFRVGKISADQQAQRLNDLETQKLEIEKAYLQTRINTILARLTSDDDKAYKEDLKEWSKLLSDKQKAEDNYQKNRQKNISNDAV